MGFKVDGFWAKGSCLSILKMSWIGGKVFFVFSNGNQTLRRTCSVANELFSDDCLRFPVSAAML